MPMHRWLATVGPEISAELGIELAQLDTFIFETPDLRNSDTSGTEGEPTRALRNSDTSGTVGHQARALRSEDESANDGIMWTVVDGVLIIVCPDGMIIIIC